MKTIPRLVLLLSVLGLFPLHAQRDAPVWECNLPRIALHHARDASIVVDVLFRKNGGPVEHTQYQLFVLAYLKSDEQEIQKVASDPELLDKSNQTRQFLDVLLERKLVVSLDSKVAKLTPRQVGERDKKSATEDLDGEFGFPFIFKWKDEKLFKALQKLGNFDKEIVSAGKSATYFKDRLKLMVFVPVNDSKYSTKVPEKMREAGDFGEVLYGESPILYFRPLPYELQFKAWDDGRLAIYIN